MTFSDLCKAYLRYWYVILGSMLIALTMVLTIMPSSTTYNAKSTLIVESVTPGDTVTTSYAESVVNTMTMIIEHNDFIEEIILKIKETDEEFANTLTPENIRSSLNVVYPKNSVYFEITFEFDNKAKAKQIVDVATQLAIDKYAEKNDAKVKFVKVYSTEVTPIKDKKAMFSFVGILAGAVFGVVCVTCFMIFNPYVEDKNILEKMTELDVLATIEKK